MKKQKAILSRINFPGRQETMAGEMVDMISFEVTEKPSGSPMNVSIPIGYSPSCVYGAFVTDVNGIKKNVGTISWTGENGGSVSVTIIDHAAVGDYVTVLVS